MGRDRARRSRWLLTPAITTGIFFAVQLILSVTTPEQVQQLRAAAPDAPSANELRVRVVAEIQAIEVKHSVPSALVPDDPEAFMRVFENDPAVIFESSEVEPVETPSREFELDEVGIIKLRRGKLRR